MKNRFLLLSGIVMFMVFTGCKKITGKGDVETRTYAISGFDGVEFAGVGEVVLVPDSTQFVEVETHENLFDLLDIIRDDHTLTIRVREGYTIKEYAQLVYYVHSPDLKDVHLSGSGNMKSLHSISASEFRVRVSGSGNVSLKGIDSQSLETYISGSGNVDFTGNVFHSLIDISGAGSVTGFELTASQTDVAIVGSGSVETSTLDALNVNISGSGNVKYKGNPTITMTGTGSGDVIDAN